MCARKKKLTRRDFLSSGAVRGLGYVCLPSIATLIHNSRGLAEAGCDVSSVAADVPAFIAVDLAGGAGIAGNNVMVYKNGGEEVLDSGGYVGLGLPPGNLHPSNPEKINTDIGLPMHADSPILRGIRATTQPAVLANVNGCVICTQSADDTGNNELATAPGIFKGGAQGSIVPLLSMREAVPGGSGGNSATPFTTNIAPTQITGAESARQIISPGNLWNNNPGRLERVLKLIQGLSSAQSEHLGQLTLPQQTQKIIDCGYVKASDLMKPPDSSNPQGNTSLAYTDDNTVTGLTNGLNGLQGREAILEIGYLVLKGYAGSGTITLGGYDYHNGTATTGDQRDEQAGRVIGSLLAMAATLGRKLMIHIYTDGGVYSEQNGTQETVPGAIGQVQKLVWRGDAEARSAAFVLVYDPAGRPDLKFQQMGAYKSEGGGTVDLNPEKQGKISQNPSAQASAIVANWLAWQGREAEFLAKVASDSPLLAGELDDYLFMQKT